MGDLFQDGLADGTVSRNITLTLTLDSQRQENGNTTKYNGVQQRVRK
jgi:hypothetical protein